MRHHHASNLLSKGVNPAKSPNAWGTTFGTLLATCAHVMPTDDDRVRSIVDDTLGGAGSAADRLAG